MRSTKAAGQTDRAERPRASLRVTRQGLSVRQLAEYVGISLAAKHILKNSLLRPSGPPASPPVRAVLD